MNETEAQLPHFKSIMKQNTKRKAQLNQNKSSQDTKKVYKNVVIASNKHYTVRSRNSSNTFNSNTTNDITYPANDRKPQLISRHNFISSEK